MKTVVSVIVPCYNQAGFLPEAIASVRAQTYPHWECVIVNDGATDDTARVAEQLAETDQRIRVVHQANRGLAGARNRGLEEARGHLVQFLDADDLIAPDKLAAQVRVLEGDPDAAVVYSDFAYFNGNRAAELIASPEQFGRKYRADDAFRALLSGNFIVVHGALTRRNAILDVGGFDTSLTACEDYALWLHLAARGRRFCFCDGMFALYRQHDGRMSNDRGRQLRQTIAALERVPGYRALTNDESEIWARYVGELHIKLMAHDAVNHKHTLPTPLVSVCVPTYNGVRHLRECLDSVLSQTLKEMEIIAVDDHSSDGTWPLLLEYAARNPLIRVFRNEANLGLVGNWNRCLSLARGKWVKFVFQDDGLTPTCLERMVLAGEESQALLTVCRRRFVFESVPDSLQKTYRKYQEEASLDAVSQGHRTLSPEAFADAVLRLNGVNFIGEPTAVMIHRDAITRFGSFRPESHPALRSGVLDKGGRSDRSHLCSRNAGVLSRASWWGDLRERRRESIRERCNRSTFACVRVRILRSLSPAAEAGEDARSQPSSGVHLATRESEKRCSQT